MRSVPLCLSLAIASTALATRQAQKPSDRGRLVKSIRADDSHPAPISVDRRLVERLERPTVADKLTAVEQLTAADVQGLDRAQLQKLLAIAEAVDREVEARRNGQTWDPVGVSRPSLRTSLIALDNCSFLAEKVREAPVGRGQGILDWLHDR